MFYFYFSMIAHLQKLEHGVFWKRKATSLGLETNYRVSLWEPIFIILVALGPSRMVLKM